MIVYIDGSVIIDGGVNLVFGYGVFEVDNVEDVIKMVKGCFVLVLGGLVELVEIFDL